MKWIGLVADGMMAIAGVVMLLYGYRLLGKHVGADEKYDAAMSRHSSGYRIVGWCIVAMAIIGLLSHLLDSVL
jgi:hypothetical protein